MKNTEKYNLKKPELSDYYDVNDFNANMDVIDSELHKINSEHILNTSNPHNVTKVQLGLGSVENKSSADIRGELEAADVSGALGYTPAQSNHTHSYAAASTAGGAATSAKKLLTDAGDTDIPVYFEKGVPVACTKVVNLSDAQTMTNKTLTAPVIKSSLNFGRKANTGTGNASTTFGAENESSGGWSVSGGYGCAATEQCSTSIGMYNTVTANQAAALNDNNTVSATSSFACNSANTVSGSCSFACNSNNVASGTRAFAGGFHTTALDYQVAFGHYNDVTKATASNGYGAGSTGTILVLGNGTSSASSNAFRITAQGLVYSQGNYFSTGADLAELREWKDGNSNHEDRRGFFVTMDGMNIKIADEGDYVCGIVSANPCLVGNGDQDWMGRYVFDEFGSFVYETVQSTDPDTGEVIDVLHYKMNPEYDPTKEYVQRIDRPEWDYVGLCGVINTRDDGTCEVNGFCRCGKGGIATKADRGYRVVERVNDHIIKVLFFLGGEIY